MTTRPSIPWTILIGACLAFDPGTGMRAQTSPPPAEETAAAATTPDEEAVSGEITVSGQALGEDPPDAAKFSEYREVPRGFLADRLILRWRPQPMFYMDLEALNVSREDSRGLLRFGRVDLWSASVRWNDNPRRWGDGAEALFAHQGDGVFTLDDLLQAAVQVSPNSVDTSPADGEWDVGTKGAFIKGAIEEGAQPIEVEYQRSTVGAGVRFTPTSHLIVTADWDRERRQGTSPQPLGQYFSLSPAEVAAPIDYRTDNQSAGLEYQGRTWNLGARLAASQFDTRQDTLIWDNQTSLVDQPVSASLTSMPGRSRMTLGTDNDLVQATVFGSLSLPGRTRLDGTFSWSETEQDDPFQPMTINANLDPLLSPLPAASYSGKHQTALVDVRLSSRPLDWFRWKAWGRSWEMKNESPDLVFAEYVQTDYAIPLCASLNACDANGNGLLDDRIQRRSLPYAGKRENFGALAGFSPARWVDFSVFYERQDVTREFSGVEDSSEDIVGATLNLTAGDWLTLRTSARVQERRAEHYEAEYFEQSFPIGEPYVANGNPGSRRHIWTDRDRDAVDLFFEITPSEKWSIYADGTYVENSYFDPETGLPVGDSFTDAEDRNFDGTPENYTIRLVGRTFDRTHTHTVGVAFAPGPRFDIFADYSWESFTYELAQRYRAPTGGIGSDNPLDDWGSDAHDTYETAALGFNARFGERQAWGLSLTASQSKGEGDISTDFVPGGASSGNTTLTEFPHLESTLTIAIMALTHKLSERFDYTIRWWYEKWEEDNWASDQMQPYMGDPGNDPGSAQAIYLGLDFDNYKANVFSLLGRYRF